MIRKLVLLALLALPPGAGTAYAQGAPGPRLPAAADVPRDCGDLGRFFGFLDGLGRLAGRERAALPGAAGAEEGAALAYVEAQIATISEMFGTEALRCDAYRRLFTQPGSERFEASVDLLAGSDALSARARPVFEAFGSYLQGCRLAFPEAFERQCDRTLDVHDLITLPDLQRLQTCPDAADRSSRAWVLALATEIERQTRVRFERREPGLAASLREVSSVLAGFYHADSRRALHVSAAEGRTILQQLLLTYRPHLGPRTYADLDLLQEALVVCADG